MCGERIFNLIKDCRTVSITGTDKNAGKTTVLNYLLKICRNRSRTGITSIGLDGSEGKLAANTLKPRIYVTKDTIIASSHRCILRSDITKEIIDATGIKTPLGEVVICRALSDGFVELGGPSKVSRLVKVCTVLEEMGCRPVLIDGAINRKSHSNPSLADGVILAAGISLSGNIDNTVNSIKMMSLHRIKNAKLLNTIVEELEHYKIAVVYKDYSSFGINPGAVFEVPAHVIEKLKKRPVWMAVDGIVSNTLLNSIMKEYSDLEGITLIARDSTKFFTGMNIIKAFENRGGRLRVISPVNILGVAVNPHFTATYINQYAADSNYVRKLMFELEEQLKIPVFNAGGGF